MNRIIRFRAWDKKKKVMLLPTIKLIWGELPSFASLDKGEFKLMQFTGLLDKNGNEIYEGDLFGKLGGDVEKPDEYEIHARVYFDEDMSAFCIDDNRGGWEYLFDYLYEKRNEREIIGNVWENPELLEKGKPND